MPKYDIITKTIGQKLFLLVPMNASKTNEDTKLVWVQGLSKCARQNGKQGEIVIIWKGENNSVRYFPKVVVELRDFARRSTYSDLLAQTDSGIECDF